ncbi:MAG: type II toxin-antitoxin system RelE/ParE family toxin [Gammaproteobacteria bacterium]
MRNVVFYRMESGRCPVEEFLDTLAAKQAQKVAWVLQLVEEMEAVPVQYFKKLVGTDGIWEVRVQLGGNIFRLLGFLDGADLVVLDHAFQKKTQETPRREIRIAEDRKRDYLNRKDP